MVETIMTLWGYYQESIFTTPEGRGQLMFQVSILNNILTINAVPVA